MQYSNCPRCFKRDYNLGLESKSWTSLFSGAQSACSGTARYYCMRHCRNYKWITAIYSCPFISPPKPRGISHLFNIRQTPHRHSSRRLTRQENIHRIYFRLSDSPMPLPSRASSTPKISKACVPCRTRKIKCNAAVVGLPCGSCVSRECPDDCVLSARKRRTV